MQLRAIGDKIIIEKFKRDRVSPGGIYFNVNENHEQHYEGKIISLGKGNVILDHLFPFDVKTGDHVLFAKHSGEEIEIEGKTLFIIKEPEILAKIDENNQLIPISDVLLCVKAENKTESAGGIILASQGVRQDKAIVLRKGRGRFTTNGKYDDFGIEVGETVLFDSTRGINIEWDNKKFTFLGMSTILATSDDEIDIEIDNTIF